MSLFTKIYRSVTFRCFGALALGLAIVSVIAFELATLTFDGDLQSDTLASAKPYVMPFPENEDMLRDMAMQMMQIERELDHIEPAAGNTSLPH
jgi:hypothetical protein